MAAHQLKRALSTSAPDLVLHFDLNKTVLAVDEVKKYGREEVSEWCAAARGGRAAAHPHPPMHSRHP